jgi:hypothetical protein
MESISACKSMKFLMVIMQMISLINLLRNPNAMRITGMFIPLVSLKRCIRHCSDTTDKQYELSGECYAECPAKYYGFN